MSNEDVSVHSMSDDDNDAKQKFTTCQPIVNRLLTFVISIMHNSTDPKLVDIIGVILTWNRSKIANHYCVMPPVSRSREDKIVNHDQRRWPISGTSLIC